VTTISSYNEELKSAEEEDEDEEYEAATTRKAEKDDEELKSASASTLIWVFMCPCSNCSGTNNGVSEDALIS
jgi:hypothetical protein